MEQQEIIGKFNGENMVCDNGQTFIVPPNYASKSKLVEGDMLKAFIKDNGEITFKQIGSIGRVRFIGTVTEDLKIEFEGKVYEVINASVRYFHFVPGMKVAVITSPKSTWCAVESVIPDFNQDIEM